MLLKPKMSMKKFLLLHILEFLLELLHQCIVLNFLLDHPYRLHHRLSFVLLLLGNMIRFLHYNLETHFQQGLLVCLELLLLVLLRHIHHL
jgi:hypothetical protein